MIRTGVFLWTAESILTFLKEVAIDTWQVVEPQMIDQQDMVFVFPNVPLSGLAGLKEELTTMANADSIDMTCLIYGHDVEGAKTVTERWELGCDDGSQSIFVRIYSQEYFRTKVDFLELLAETFS